jgi:uncharacterized protein YjiS (DUF1127 family)
MAFFSLNRSANVAMPTVFNGFGAGNLLARLSAALRVWNDKRTTRAELDMLSDRELADIGLTRSDIARVIDDLR